MFFILLLNESPQTKRWLMLLQNELLTSCRARSSGHFDIIYVAIAQLVMAQFNIEVV